MPMVVKSLVPDALPVPQGLITGNMSAWVEEAIWGHRFYNDQTPWLLLCECLGICASQAADANHKSIFPGRHQQQHESFKYYLPKREVLRYVLFRNRDVDETVDQTASSDRQWHKWLESANNSVPVDLSYLKERFTSFDAFRSAVKLLRSAELEPHRQRRYTSRHLVPLGPELLMADYGERSRGAVDKDRRFFGRGGELLFLMLNRSGHTESLEPLLRSRVLSGENRWNRLARAFQPDPRDLDASATIDFSTGYLPLPEHERYRLLAEDWISLLSLSEMPSDSLAEPLMRLSGLAVVMYLVERACSVLERKLPAFVLDMLSSDTRGVRTLATNHFALHRQLTRDAIEAYVDRVTVSAAWRQALQKPNPHGACAELIEEAFAYTVEDKKAEPEKQLDRLKEDVLANHNNHLGRVGGFYAEQIGLAVARRGAGRWYGASDGLLEALVLANVREPQELDVFLNRLWEKYHIVVGPQASAKAFSSSPIPHEQFRANQRRFEERLRVLGFVHRLSDDCAFVRNPYHERSTAAA